ncbi:unnamed protein product [Cyclocybe aegerita]|uniref:Uncharacterized protein n=1 Tax=Cyclocybe aegerita TaxID=1973307 RepID=A0A8S0XGS9_CYCAE|nr:unnamed protein product [Cyclocybe aegerita]
MPVLLHNKRFIILSQYEYFSQRIMAIKDAHRRGVALIGNPGIGKSSFLIFMLLKRLVNQEHVVLALRSRVYVFNSNGVFATRSGTDLAVLFDSPAYKDVLALVDSDEEVREPDPGLVHSGLFAVHATSPQQARYKIWVNQKRAITLVMDPLTIDDMHALVSLESPHCLREEVEAAMLMYGSNSRTIADIFQDPDGDLLQETKIAQSLDRLSLSQLEELIRKPDDGDKQITHALIQSASSRPPPQEGDRRYLATDTMVHSIASPYIWKLLYKKFMDSSLQEIRRLFVSLAGMTSSNAMRGWLFEAWSHDRLCQGEFAFTLTEMVKISSRLVRGQNTRQLPLGPKREFEIYPSSTKFANTKDGDKYYVPQEGNNPTFDSFIRVSHQLGIGFQMTISPTHALKVKGLELLSKRIDTKERMFVFVIPTGHTFDCETSTRWMNKFKFYILEVDFGHPILQKGVSLRLETPSDDSEMDMSE